MQELLQEGIRDLFWWPLFLGVVGGALSILFVVGPFSKRKVRSLLDAAYAVVVGEGRPVSMMEFQRSLRSLNPQQEETWRVVNEFLQLYDPVAKRERRMRQLLGVAAVCADAPVLVGIVGTLMAVGGSVSAQEASLQLPFAIWTTLVGILTTIALKLVYEWKEPFLTEYADEMQQLKWEFERWQKSKDVRKHTHRVQGSSS